MKRKLTIFVVFIIIIIVSGLRAYGNWETAIYDTNVSTSAYENVGEIHNDTIIKQEFYCEFNGLSGLNIRAATYNRINSSRLRYSVKDEAADNIVAEGIINTSELKDNSFNEILFPTINDSKNRNYVLEIRTENAEEGNSVTIFKTEKGDSSGALIVNDEEILDRALVMKMITNRFNTEYFIVFIGLILYVVLFVKLLNKFLK